MMACASVSDMPFLSSLQAGAIIKAAGEAGARPLRQRHPGALATATKAPPSGGSPRTSVVTHLRCRSRASRGPGPCVFDAPDLYGVDVGCPGHS